MHLPHLALVHDTTCDMDSLPDFGTAMHATAAQVGAEISSRNESASPAESSLAATSTASCWFFQALPAFSSPEAHVPAANTLVEGIVTETSGSGSQAAVPPE